MPTLSAAIVLAAEKHAGTTDKAGAPYILHALRVMLRLSTDDERIAGVLHDVIEDTDVTLDQLRAMGFPAAAIVAIDAVTRREDESYEQFVERAGRDPIGRRVKLADLEDNSDLSRLANPTAHDLERVERYRRAIAYLRHLESGVASHLTEPR